MKIGFVHFSSEERRRVNNALQRLREQGSVDELGIGRVRDAFADLLFPGISTLQHHAKYFAVLPQLYHLAQKENYKSPREVKAKIIELEIKLTKNLVAGSEPGTGGITGSSVVEGDKYVKYNPTYIYWTGLVAFGIMKESGSLYNLIYDYSRHEKNVKYRDKEAEEGGIDDDEGDGTVAFYSKPTCNFDISKKMNIKLNKSEALFIKRHIISSEKTRKTLLAYFLEHNEITNRNNSFLEFDISQIQDLNIRKQLELARKFTRFIFPMHVRYNYIYADGCGNELAKNELHNQFLKELNKSNDVHNKETLSEIFSFLGSNLNDPSIRIFCEKVLNATREGKSTDDFSKLDNILVDRERDIKGNVRYKLRHPAAYSFDPNHLVHYHHLTYRWETAWTMINEIREGLGVGNG